jgi:thiol-disulfide isomerase/thioredoxin
MLYIALTLALTVPLQPKPTLSIGSPAPALKVTKWLQGDAVSGFEPGKVYVVDFWATWCGPCIGSMPYLSELQDDLKDKGVVVVGITSRDDKNTEKQVVDFIKERSGILRYRVAWCDNSTTSDAYVKAAVRTGLPCSFVVDQQGKIAFIGHPTVLPEVLPAILAGTWRGKSDADLAERSLDAFFEMLGNANIDPHAGIKMYAAMEKTHPRLAAQFTEHKLLLYVRTSQMDEAEKLFNDILAKAVKRRDGLQLSSISWIWGNTEINKPPHKLNLAVQAAEEALKLEGRKDLNTYIAAAQAYHAIGDKTKAAEFAQKSIDTAEDAHRDLIRGRVQRFLQ